MGVLEQVTNMKAQGKSEQEIINALQQQGISPREITDAIAQSQVKMAVTGQNNPQNQGMQTSIMKKETPELAPPKPEDSESEQEEHYIPQKQPYMPKMPQTLSQYSPQPFQQDFYQPEQDYETNENYDTDTMIDVAEQVFAEKMSEIGKQLDNLKELKVLTKSKIEHIEERLMKIESIIAKLQIEILKKVGSYGDNLQSIKNEMSMMQNSFGKIINPLVNKANQPTRTAHKKKATTEHVKKVVKKR